ncbi:MAG: beta-ketoacyl-[acyl-carrier-protein] synthase family protein [Pyrinomonadaceae bacterium]|nr:beta-ketoacyl-[acyl-carrier-protein] synthase family protein [Phycisphaerales bacterium]
MSKRVVITGMGWITPLGHDVASVWDRLLAGHSGIGAVTHFDASTCKTNFAAEIRNFQLATFLSNTGQNEASTIRSLATAGFHDSAGISTQYALAAATQAWRQAGLDKSPSKLRSRRMGMYLGAGEGSLDNENFFATNLAGWDADKRTVDAVKWATAAYERMSAMKEIEQEPNLALSHLAAAFGCRGPSSNCMTACAASTQAIGEAFETIKHSDADIMFAGGAHSMIHPIGMTGFIRLTAMSRRCDSPQTAARPFDRTRDGFVMGEGAGMLVLEELDHALARGATPLVEIVGYGSTADAFRITDIQADGLGAVGAMSEALRQAGVNPREPDATGRAPVQYISAHGTGTSENDAIETKAVRTVFGSQAQRVPFSSVKSMLGHLIQAAGAVELMTCVMAIKTGWVPPTMNLNESDPECDLDYVPNKARDMNPIGGVDLCLSNSFGFGGQNDTIAVRRYTK